MKHLSAQRQSGFTLIEIIAALLLVGILAAVIVPYLGSSFYRSSEPIFNLQTTLGLQESMEKITAKYKALKGATNVLATLKTQIDGGNFTTGDQNAATAYITIDSGNANEPQILQVKLTSTKTGESLTVLFTE